MRRSNVLTLSPSVSLPWRGGHVTVADRNAKNIENEATALVL
jgi:hypothetical protein